MARARMIKPGFFANDELAELEPFTRLLFAGLWTLADREGRLEDRPKRIKGELFRYDDLDIDSMLSALAERGFIDRYEADGMSCIQVVNFSIHQRPHNNEIPSCLPPRSKALSTKVESPPTNDESASALNRNLEPRTQNLELEPELDNESLEIEKTDDEPTPIASKGGYSDEFESFWDDYPRDHGIKSKAFSEWKRLTKAERIAAKDSLPAFRLGDRWQRGYILDCHRWLKDKAFETPPLPWSLPINELPPPLRKRVDNWIAERTNEQKPILPYPDQLTADIADWRNSQRLGAA